MATVTVIIPTFNRRTLLLAALSSVFTQTYQDYEILVVDDGSTDGTREALAPLSAKVRYCWKPHGGEASARNRGVREATTPYIAFLDSDDLWEPTFLHTTISTLESDPALALVATGCVVIPAQERRPRIRESALRGDLFQALFVRNFITASAVVVRRACFQRVGLFNESLDQAEDYDLWLRIARDYPIAFINQPLCRWRKHAGNLSGKELRHRVCTLQVVESHYDPRRISPLLYRRRRSRLQVSLGRALLEVGRTEEAKGCFREAIALTPFRFRPWRYLGATLLAEKCRGLIRGPSL